MTELTKKDLQFLRSLPADVDAIFDFYDDAIAFQKTVFKTHWKGFERSLIEKEVEEGRQWKIIKDGRIACIFAVEFSDPLIWREKNADPSIYLHRIVSHSSFRGSSFMADIVDWSKDYGKSIGKQYIRLDTWGDNPQLIKYYVKSGFRHIGFTTPESSPSLPKHYAGIELSLFELTID